MSTLRLWILPIAAVLLLSSTALSQDRAKREMPADFKSDGCTLFPDGNYHDCCVEHDKAYYFGGSFKARRAADRELHECVLAHVGKRHKLTADIMWLGVRLGGLWLLPTKFRWGFGNKYPRKERVASATGH